MASPLYPVPKSLLDPGLNPSYPTLIPLPDSGLRRQWRMVQALSPSMWETWKKTLVPKSVSSHSSYWGHVESELVNGRLFFLSLRHSNKMNKTCFKTSLCQVEWKNKLIWGDKKKNHEVSWVCMVNQITDSAGFQFIGKTNDFNQTSCVWLKWLDSCHPCGSTGLSSGSWLQLCSVLAIT